MMNRHSILSLLAVPLFACVGIVEEDTGADETTSLAAKGGGSGGGCKKNCPDAAPTTSGPELLYSNFGLHPLGSAFEVTGTNLIGVTAVEIGGVEQTEYTIVSDSKMTIDALDDATPVGTESLVVTSDEGTSEGLSLRVIDLSANAGVWTQGEWVTLTSDLNIFYPSFTQALVSGAPQSVRFHYTQSQQIIPTLMDVKLDASAGTGTVPLQVQTLYGLSAPIPISVVSGQ